MTYTLNRPVTRTECSWLDFDLAAGLTVHRYRGHTYGCIGPNGTAVSIRVGEHPFFEVPTDALTPIDAQ